MFLSIKERSLINREKQTNRKTIVDIASPRETSRLLSDEKTIMRAKATGLIVEKTKAKGRRYSAGRGSHYHSSFYVLFALCSFNDT